ncbi:hypothetical protein [Enterobacter pseudoroggenkampii]|uniref:hypothetical protein n=1 Tax=Enterobacter pseudoroggenkampii TaxID=2996112 RepID=UPI0038A0FAB6
MIDLNCLHFVSSELFSSWLLTALFSQKTLLFGVEWAHTAMLSGFLSAKWICVFKSDPDYYCSSDCGVFSAQ